MSGRLWQHHQAATLEENGEFERCPIEACIFVHFGKFIFAEIHGDDSFAIGPRESIVWFREFMQEHFECRVGDIIGPEVSDAHQGKFLKKPFWVDESGWHYEADPKHIEQLVRRHGCEGAKGSDTTGSHEVGLGDNEKLTPGPAGQYRSDAGTFMYVANDRFDIKYPAKELMRCIGEPTTGAAAKLKRLVRYASRYPRLVNHFYRLAVMEGQGVVGRADADHAGNKVDRKSSTGMVWTYEGLCIMYQSITQPVVALSSGESEFYAICRCVCLTLYLINLIEWLTRRRPAGTVESDSSAGRGMVSRAGVGKKAKHIAVQYLFMQDISRAGLIQLGTVAGGDNTADLGTKYVTGSVLAKLLEALHMERLGPERT